MQRHQWGSRPEVRATAPRKIVRETGPQVEVVIRLDGTPDRLVRCQGCGTRVYESLQEPACWQCGAPMVQGVASTEDHLYVMYGGVRYLA